MQGCARLNPQLPEHYLKRHGQELPSEAGSGCNIQITKSLKCLLLEAGRVCQIKHLSFSQFSSLSTCYSWSLDIEIAGPCITHHGHSHVASFCDRKSTKNELLLELKIACAYWQ